MADVVLDITHPEEVIIPLKAIPIAVTSATYTPNGPPGEMLLGWLDDGDRGDFYDIEYSTDAGFSGASTLTIAYASLYINTTVISGLNLAVTNYFRIKVRNASGSSAWVNFILSMGGGS